MSKQVCYALLVVATIATLFGVGQVILYAYMYYHG